MLLVLVRVGAFQWENAVRLSNSVDHSSHVFVGIASDGLSDGSLKSSVSASDEVRNVALGLGSPSNDGMPRVAKVSVDVSSTINLEHVSLLNFLTLVLERRVVESDLVNADTGGEGDSPLGLLGLLSAVDLFEFLLDEVVS